MAKRTPAATKKSTASSTRLADKMHYAEKMPEIHGFLSGFICSGFSSEGKNWLDSLLGYIGNRSQDMVTDRTQLIEIYKAVSVQIEEEQANFTLPFLRGALSLPERTLLLKRWCCGFIAGFQPPDEMTSTDMMDSLQRLNGIAQLDLQQIEIHEHDEMMFKQVTELLELAIVHLYRLHHHDGNVKH